MRFDISRGHFVLFFRWKKIRVLVSRSQCGSILEKTLGRLGMIGGRVPRWPNRWISRGGFYSRWRFRSFQSFDLTRETTVRDPLTGPYIWVRTRAHSRGYVNKGVQDGKEATKVAYERDPANPRGRPWAYQFASNVGYPLEYDQQLDVLFQEVGPLGARVESVSFLRDE